MSKKNIINFQSVDSIQLYLHSGNADTYINGSKKSSLVFFFEDPITVDKKVVSKCISVVNAQFPVSWYLINETNNAIRINGTYYYIPYGNYNVTNFVQQCISTFGSNFNVSYNSITNKFTFTNSVADFTFSDNESNSIFKILGFQSGNSYTSTSKSLAAPYSCDFGGLLKLEIKSNTFTLKNCNSHNKGRSRTICSVPINSNQNGVIMYNNFTLYKSIIKNSVITDINIDIHDEFKNFIDFNNHDWSLTLQIDMFLENVEDLDTLNDVYEYFRSEN